MPADDVTAWLGRLQAGDPAAARPLWDRYFHRLVGLARSRLRDAPRRAADEEDVALSAFDSFCRNAEAGRFPDRADRESLWRLLAAFTLRKATRHLRAESRQKRGGAVTPSGSAPRPPRVELRDGVSVEARPDDRGREVVLAG